MRKYLFYTLLLLFPLILHSHGDEKTTVKEEFVKPKKIFTEHDNFSVKIIEMDNWLFSEDIIELEKNMKYRLIFITVNGHHGVVFPDLKMQSDNIPLGETVSFDLEFNKVEEIDFYCNIPCGAGHSQMNGKIVVK